MNILIVAATESEIAPFLKVAPLTDVLITGVGIPLTVFHLTKKLFEKNYDLAIQAGIAGTFDGCFQVEETVLVKEDTFADMGIDENGNFKTVFEAGLINDMAFPFEHGWLKNTHPLFEKSALPAAAGVTVNKITDDDFTIKKMQQKFSAGIETMEGAAFHYVCLCQKISFIQIRAISNVVGERNKSKWKMKEAIKNLNTELLNLIKTFK